ncbi:MAG: hypothetical protein JEY91_19635 [Spirochaetaceae bacterium]|nr:hypothetical protein [Spirochaetaceae bacterium]
MRRLFLLVLLIFHILMTSFAVDYTKSESKDSDIGSRLIISSSEGLVPNEEVAIKIAEAILVYQYGEDVIENRPFIAELTENGTVWYVKGTFPHSDEKGYWGGGVPHIKIAKADGKIIGFIHGE